MSIGALNRAQSHAAGKNEALAEGIIAGRIDAGADVRREAALQRSLRLDQRGDAKTLGRVEQIVAEVEAHLAGKGSDVERAPPAFARGEIVLGFGGAEQLDARGICELLLPDRRRITADPRRQPASIGVVGLVIAAQRLGRQFERAVALAGVGAPEDDAAALFLRARDAPHDQGAPRA